MALNNTSQLELVFIPAPGLGHLVSTVEMAKSLVHRHPNLSIVLILMSMPFPDGSQSYLQSLSLSQRIRLIYLPPPTHLNLQQYPFLIYSSFITSQKQHIKDTLSKLYLDQSQSPRLAGIVVDLFCTSMIDVANDLGVPSYVFFTSNAAFLGLMFHLHALHSQSQENKDVLHFNHSHSELLIPSFVHPFPAKLLPSTVLHKESSAVMLGHARRMRETEGILINTFTDLESAALQSLRDDKNIPPVYPVGPLLSLDAAESRLESDKRRQRSQIIEWLDSQPPSSVVFLCFGSMGSFDEDQVKEMANALEQSGHRFLWSLRQPPEQKKFGLPSEYTNVEEVLPEGFLERTAGIGKVIGWAPQIAVLGHPAVGGFVSHCGWNSVLESLWNGVAIGAWPMYAEQQFNAFEMVKELGVAVEIKMKYSNAGEQLKMVKAEEIEKGIRSLMEGESEVRKKVKEMKEKSRKVLMEDGSSFVSLGNFIQSVVDNMPIIPKSYV